MSTFKHLALAAALVALAQARGEPVAVDTTPAVKTFQSRKERREHEREARRSKRRKT